MDLQATGAGTSSRDSGGSTGRRLQDQVIRPLKEGTGDQTLSLLSTIGYRTLFRVSTCLCTAFPPHTNKKKKCRQWKLNICTDIEDLLLWKDILMNRRITRDDDSRAGRAQKKPIVQIKSVLVICVHEAHAK
jgi:hypothetical protein